MRRRNLLLVGLATTALGLTGVAPANAHPGHEADALPVEAGDFQKVTLNDRPGEPMALAVLPDRRVLHTARNGEVFIHDPESGVNFLAADMRESPQGLYLHDEEGVQGVAVDPDFAENQWVYLYYSPRLDTPIDDPATATVNEGDAPEWGTQADWDRFKGHLNLSRFKLVDNELDFDSEQVILEVPVDRGLCCHVGGKIDFDRHGTLYLSTGDDTNPFQSDGYTPVDDREGRNPAFDARRSSGNTNDLRGKLLRIDVQEDGSYTIPDDNLFEPGTEKTRPEIYAMGLRNPFRFTVDSKTGDVYMADYSPDAQQDDPDRGPSGRGRYIVIDRAANYGWPFCVTRDLAYNDHDFEAEESGPEFDCKKTVNDSAHNTGLELLPRMAKPEVSYGYGLSEEFPEFGTGGIGPMAGPAYRYDKKSTSQVRWPAEYDGLALFHEWTRDWTLAMTIGSNSKVQHIEDAMPGIISDGVMDSEFGPDGALYMLEYGTGYFAEFPEAQLSRIDYLRGNSTPEPVVAADLTNGPAPLTVQLSSEGTTDADGDALTYAWDFDADGDVDSTEPSGSWTYAANGVYEPTLKVTDSTGRSASASVEVVVGNTAPVVTLVTDPAPHGDAFGWGDTVSWTVTVEDDQPVDCSRVSVSYILGHDTHGHPLSTQGGCSGSFVTFLDGGHAGADNIRAVFNASYTDAPEGDLPALSGNAQIVLEPSDD